MRIQENGLLLVRAVVRAVVAGLLLVWLAGILRAFCSACMGPDEISYFTYYARQFADVSRERGVIGGWLYLLFGLENTVGYGASYWAAYAASFRLTSSPVACMRAVAVVCWLGVPAAILGGGPRQWTWTRMAAVVLYLSTPMAWWTAKLSGPEFISVGLGYWGVLALQSRRESSDVDPWRTVLGGLIIGLAAGIKLSTAPLLVFAGVWCLCQPSAWKRASWFGLGVAAGIVLSNPFLLVAPGRFFENLRSISRGGEVTLERLRMVLTVYYWQWDGVYCSGWIRTAFTLNATLAIGLAMIVGRISWREVVPIAAAAAAMIAMLLSNGIFFGWYWFAVVPLLPLALPRTDPQSAFPSEWQPAWRLESRPAIVVGLALFAAAINLPNTLAMNSQQARQLREHEETLRTMPQITARLETAYSAAESRGNAPCLILNHLVLDSDFGECPLPIARSIGTSHPEPIFLESLIDLAEPNELEVWMMVNREAMRNNCLTIKPVCQPRSPQNPAGYRSIVYEEGTVRVWSYRVHHRHAEFLRQLVEAKRRPGSAP